MPTRTTVLFVTLVAALFLAVASWGVVAPAYQVSVMASFAVLGLFAVPVVMKLGKRRRLRPNHLAREEHRLRRLRRLSEELELDSPGGFDEPEREIRVYHWPEVSESGQDPRFLRGSLDEYSIAQNLGRRLAPPAPELPADGTQSTQKEQLAELVREGDNLKALGQLLKLDLAAYGNQLAKGIAAARRDRFEECVLILQLANERLRGEVQSSLAKNLSPLRTRTALGR